MIVYKTMIVNTIYTINKIHL